MPDTKKNVYGENHAVDGIKDGDHTVAQDTAEGTDEQFERVREQAAQDQPEGGMGRTGTPKTSQKLNFELAGEPENPRD
ncbi:MAG: hypothetical protein ACAH95_16225 [Fimbriimonas sp.]